MYWRQIKKNEVMTKRSEWFDVIKSKWISLILPIVLFPLSTHFFPEWNKYFSDLKWYSLLLFSYITHQITCYFGHDVCRFLPIEYAILYPGSYKKDKRSYGAVQWRSSQDSHCRAFTRLCPTLQEEKSDL